MLDVLGGGGGVTSIASSTAWSLNCIVHVYYVHLDLRPH